MKKNVLRITLTSIMLISFNSFASPSIITVHIICPNTTNIGLHALTRYPTRVSGYGTETINGAPAFNSPYFNFAIPNGANIPTSFNTYSSSGASFNFSTGIVSCSYTSSGAFTPFTVQYELTNFMGAQISAQTASTITINQFIG